MRQKFPSCGSKPLGLYPIVDNYKWLEKLLPLGVTTIQLRIKDKPLTEVETQIKHGVALAKQYAARLFVNDYWSLAIKEGAYGVHLGQEDLDNADLIQIHRSGLRLGISTHSLDEIHRALSLEPSYLAFGPIYPTSSKPMAFVPQGIKKLHYWREHLNYPLVAIGGINVARMPEVLKTGVSGVALISAITQAVDPIATTRKMLELVCQNQS